MSLLNERIEAWKGSEKGKKGIVIRVDGVYHCYVKWEDDTVSHCAASDLIAEKYLRQYEKLKTVDNPVE